MIGHAKYPFTSLFRSLGTNLNFLFFEFAFFYLKNQTDLFKSGIFAKENFQNKLSSSISLIKFISLSLKRFLSKRFLANFIQYKWEQLAEILPCVNPINYGKYSEFYKRTNNRNSDYSS